MLVTVADAKEYMGIGSADFTIPNTIIEGMINAVGDIFDNELNRTLESATFTMHLDGTGTQSIFVPAYPIVSITSINIDSDRVFGSDTLVSSGDYVVYNSRGEITMVKSTYPVRYNYFPIGKQNVKIVYVGGYSTTGTVTLPHDLQKAAKDQVKFLFKKWQSGEEGLTSYSSLNSNVNLVEATDILPMVSRVLDKYRNYYHG